MLKPIKVKIDEAPYSDNYYINAINYYNKIYIYGYPIGIVDADTMEVNSASFLYYVNNRIKNFGYDLSKQFVITAFSNDSFFQINYPTQNIDIENHSTLKYSINKDNGNKYIWFYLSGYVRYNDMKHILCMSSSSSEKHHISYAQPCYIDENIAVFSTNYYNLFYKYFISDSHVSNNARFVLMYKDDNIYYYLSNSIKENESIKILLKKLDSGDPSNEIEYKLDLTDHPIIQKYKDQSVDLDVKYKMGGIDHLNDSEYLSCTVIQYEDSTTNKNVCIPIFSKIDCDFSTDEFDVTFIDNPEINLYFNNIDRELTTAMLRVYHEDDKDYAVLFLINQGEGQMDVVSYNITDNIIFDHQTVSLQVKASFPVFFTSDYKEFFIRNESSYMFYYIKNGQLFFNYSINAPKDAEKDQLIINKDLIYHFNKVSQTLSIYKHFRNINVNIVFENIRYEWNFKELKSWFDVTGSNFDQNYVYRIKIINKTPDIIKFDSNQTEMMVTFTKDIFRKRVPFTVIKNGTMEVQTELVESIPDELYIYSLQESTIKIDDSDMTISES